MIPKEVEMNPVKKTRERLGLSVKELALALGVSYSTVMAHEVGLPRRLGASLRPGLQKLGINIEELAEAYARWREETGEVVLAGQRFMVAKRT